MSERITRYQKTGRKYRWWYNDYKLWCERIFSPRHVGGVPIPCGWARGWCRRPHPLWARGWLLCASAETRKKQIRLVASWLSLPADVKRMGGAFRSRHALSRKDSHLRVCLTPDITEREELPGSRQESPPPASRLDPWRHKRTSSRIAPQDEPVRPLMSEEGAESMGRGRSRRLGARSALSHTSSSPESAARIAAKPKNGRFSVRYVQIARNSPVHSLAFS